MKLHLPLSLRSSLLACMAFVGFTVNSAAFEPKTDLGDTMFVGDSITHGQRQASWRWNFSKILIDNNIYFNEVGVNSNNTDNSFGTNKIYGNAVFQNVHSAMSGERAYEISGRIPAPSSGEDNRLDGTNIKQWLNFDSTGNRHIGADVTPSTYFLLIGTNDLLSATGNHVSENNQYTRVKGELLGTQSENNVWSGDGDMDTIIDTMREKSGKDVDIVVLSVPTWDGAKGTANLQNLPADYECVRQYNESLKEWAEWKGVKVVDINFGLVDVANTTEPWRAVPSFIADKLHPGPQGELIISGNVARGLGYAGRTAGQLRKSAADFSAIHKNTSIAVGASRSYNWGGTDLSHGFTVDFSLSGGVGNGADGGWNTTGNFSVSVGDGTRYGTLNINEAYIQWGDTKLFSMDTSTLTDSLRIAYVYGNNARNLPTGFYIWMDDQLIGEGLGNSGGVTNGLTITNGTELEITLEDLSLDDSGSWAPSTTRLTNGNPTISVPGSISDYGKFPGKAEWAAEEDLLETAIALTQNISISGSLNGKKGITVNSGSSGQSAFANSTDYEDDIYVTLTGDVSIAGYWGFHGTRGGTADKTLSGDGYLRLVGFSAQRTLGAFFGTLNVGSGGIDGDLYTEFSSENVTIESKPFENVNSSIAGVFKATGGITGTFRVVINDGAFGNIIGGSINGDARVGSVELFLNGGILTGNVAAGGYFGSVGDRSITISGDAVSFSVLTKLITAGAVPAGSNLFGTENPTGTVDGSATVTLADMTSAARFRGWKGTLSGGQETGEARTLVFAGVQMEDMNATLENFDLLVVKSSEYTGAASDVGLSDFGGAAEIQVAAGSRLTLLAGEDGEVEYNTADGVPIVLNNDGTIALPSGVTLLMNMPYNAQKGSAWEVDGGKLILGENVVGTHHISLTDGGVLEVGDVQEGTYTVEMSRSAMTVAENAKGVYALTMRDASVVDVNGGGTAYTANMSGSSRLNVNGGQGDYTVNSADAGNKVIVGDNTSGSFDLTMGSNSLLELGENAQVADSSVKMGSDSSVTVGAGSVGDWAVELGAGSSLIVGADVSGNYDIVLAGGGTLDSRSSSITGVAVLDGEGTYDMMGGLAAGLKLTLPEATSESHVVNLGSSDVTLSGENRITLSSSMQTAEAALLDTTGRLLLDEGATLTIDVNAIAADVQRLRTGVYYLTLGDLSGLSSEGAAGKILFDATSVVLGWEITYREDGAICFHVPSAADGHNVYQSSINSDGVNWGREPGKSIYETVPAYDAVLLDRQTILDLSNDTPPAGVDSLVIHNLVGTANANLTITDSNSTHNSKITLTNSISEKDKEMLKEMSGGMEIEDSLTFAGNITLNNVGLEVKHVNPDKKGSDGSSALAPESKTVVLGNLVMNGDRDLELSSGVLELRNSSNNLGRGNVIFSGTDGQLAIVGESARALVSGKLELTYGWEDMEREHVLLAEGGTLELKNDAEVGEGVVIGNSSALLTGEAAGTLSVSGTATVAREAVLQNVVLKVMDQGALSLGSAPETEQTRARGSYEMEGTVAGIEGSGKILTQGGAVDMEIVVAGGNRVFSGDLSGYEGTMVIKGSEYGQSFVGVKGNKDWNLTNRTNAHLTLDTTANDNALTMGKLDLQRGSFTNLVFDLFNMGEDSGLHVTNLNVAQGAHITINNAGELRALTGEDGEEVSIALITVQKMGAASFPLSSIDCELVNVKNAGDIDIYYDSNTGVLYLKTHVDNSNPYTAYAKSGNAMVGARLLGELRDEVTGDLETVDGAVLKLLQAPISAGNVAAANRIMAAAAGASTAVLGQAVAGDVERQLRAIRNRTTSISGDTEGAAVTGLWLNAESDYHKMNADGMLPGYKVNGWGGTVGASRNLGHGKEVGLALTAMYNDIESEGPDRLKGDMDTYYVSAFAQVSRGAWRHTLVATVGTASVDVDRTVNYGTGSYTTSGSTDGTSFGALYEVGYSIPLRAEGTLCLQPVANVAVRHSKLDAYTESGSTAALEVGEQKSTVVTLGFGARLQAAVDGNFWNRASFFESRALVKVDCGDREGKADVAFHEAGTLQDTVRSTDRGAVGVELGAGLAVPVGRMGEVFVDASAELWQGYTNLNATVGYKIEF